ncbi:hypothetical protein GCM10025738_16460 [Microbacterium fluvii]
MADDLTPDEAERIAQQARDGRLETDDPQIRKVVTRAQRTVVRTSLWGDAPRSRRMLVLWLAIGFIALWVVGLAVPLILTFG